MYVTNTIYISFTLWWPETLKLKHYTMCSSYSFAPRSWIPLNIQVWPNSKRYFSSMYLRLKHMLQTHWSKRKKSYDTKDLLFYYFPSQLHLATLFNCKTILAWTSVSQTAVLWPKEQYIHMQKLTGPSGLLLRWRVKEEKAYLQIAVFSFTNLIASVWNF